MGNQSVTEVVAALIWEGERFLICQRPAHKARGLLWEFVGGKVEPGETGEQALIRECREELAITLSPGTKFMDVVHEYPDITVHLTLFNAKIAEGEPQKLEHNDICWIFPSEIPRYDFCPADQEILEKIMEAHAHGLIIYEAPLNDRVLEKLMVMSSDWEEENSCRGYRGNSRGDIEGNRIFLASREGEILGYLLGHGKKAERASSVMEAGTPYFEIEEIYVVPGHRSEGIGRALFRFAEQDAKAAGVELITLSTATKNYKSILHFYIDELGMDFWSARLFKRL